MKELFDLSFSAANIIPTGLFVFILLYWLTVLLGFFDFDSFDFDIDVDVDTDIDVDVDADAGGAEGGTAWLNQLLIFFNLGKIPFMVWLSFLAIPLWILSILTTTLLGIESFLFSLIVLTPLLVVTAFLAKFFTYPLTKIFMAMDKENKPKNLIGKVCTVVLSPNANKWGQADVNYDGSPLRVYVTTSKESDFRKGDKALIIEKQGEAYFIEPYTI